MDNDAPQLDSFEIREIPAQRRYWFVRTFGGKIFDYYYTHNLIGVSGNDVPMDYIQNAPHDDVTYGTLHGFITKNVIDQQSEATKLANQLITFYHEVKPGDIVLIPSENSDFIAFGEVTSNIRVQKTSSSLIHNEKVEPYPEKVRSVKWLKIMRKSDLVGDLKLLFFSRLGITNADKYGDFIESNVSTFFLKDDYYFSTLFIDLSNDQELNVFDLHRYLEALTKLYENFCAENGIEYNEELFIKIKVQSAGSVILKWTAGILVVGVAGIMMMSIVGSDPNLKFHTNAQGKTDFEAGLKGNFFKNLAEARKIEQETESKRVTDSLAAEDKKFEQLKKRKEHNLLTPEEKKFYQDQIIDTAKALKMSSVESKAVNIKEVN